MAGNRRSLNRLRWLQRSLQRGRWVVYTRVWGMDVHPTALLSLTAKLDRTHPSGVHLGEHVYVAFGASILSHDMTRGLYANTVVEPDCFIGARSIVMPGVTVGRGSIVGSGAVVTKDVPPRSIVAGNPAKVVREGIAVGHYGRFVDVD